MRKFIMCAILSCLASFSFAQTGDAQLIKVVREYADRFKELIPEKKLDEVVEMYAEDAIYAPENDMFYEGKEAIRGVWATTFAYDIKDFNMDPVSVYGNKNLIYEAGRGYSVILVQGQERRFDFKYVNVWRREKGEYKLVIDTYNTFVQK